MTTRNAVMKLTEEALCVLLKEVLDLPEDVNVVGMSALATQQGVVMLQLEGGASIPEGAVGVMGEYQRFSLQRVDGRRVIARRLVKLHDAQDYNRPLASVPDPQLEVVRDVAGEEVARRVDLASPRRKG